MVKKKKKDSYFNKLAVILILIVGLTLIIYQYADKTETHSKKFVQEHKGNVIILNQTYVTVENITDSMVSEEIEFIGLLYKTPEGCGGWCIFKPTIRGGRKIIAVDGEINESDHGKLVLINGKLEKTNEFSQVHSGSYDDTTLILRLKDYHPISSVTDDITRNSDSEIIKLFGCTFIHNKERSWKIYNGTPYFTARWEYFSKKDSYVDLWYDMDGTLYKYEDRLKDKIICN